MPNELQALIDQLDALSGEALHAAEREALGEVGQFIQAELVQRTPVQAGVPEGLLKPGQLAESIKPSVHVASDEKAVQGTSSYVSVGPRTQVCKDVANWVEYGHAGPREASPRTPPHPFIRPTQDAVEQQATALYEATMTTAITNAMK